MHWKRIKGMTGMRTWIVSCLSACICLIGCGDRSEPAVRVDMSAEHDDARFEPGMGEQVALIAHPGAFNGWRGDTLWLSDEAHDWIYAIPLDSLTRLARRRLTPEDSLAFTFAIARAKNDSARALVFAREPTIDRRATMATMTEESPVFRFGKPYETIGTATVSFAVGMNNQNVLGFFQPEKGDEVIVSGPFSSQTAIPLKDANGDGTYETTTEVQYRPGEPIRYRYRIVSERQVALPNNGWEFRRWRSLSIKGERAQMPYAAFANQRRLLRFIIDAEPLVEDGRFHPENGDVLQIRLLMDETEQLTGALHSVGDMRYEIALKIPFSVRRVQWQLTKNLGAEALTQVRDVAVGLRGKLVRWPRLPS